MASSLSSIALFLQEAYDLHRLDFCTFAPQFLQQLKHIKMAVHKTTDAKFAQPASFEILMNFEHENQMWLMTSEMVLYNQCAPNCCECDLEVLSSSWICAVGSPLEDEEQWP